MDTQAALAVLSQALKLEQEGRTFYLQAAEETLDEQGQRMFTSLADDEALHADMVLRQIHALEGEGSYVLLPDLDVRPIDLGAKLFPPARQDVEAKVGSNPTVLDALHVALENEIRSYDLYRNAAKETEGYGRQMYEWLAGAEMTHFNLLMSNYESIVSLGGWV
ncbi:MAG: ferritin-like domain-containing protein [Anaerolineae bacterium]